MPKLTVFAVKHARHHGDHSRLVRISDGKGLDLQITTRGSKWWVFRSSQPGTGRCREIGLGSFARFGPGEARRLAEEARALLRRRIDPQNERQRQQLATRAERPALSFAAFPLFGSKRERPAGRA